jgi:ABC-type polysaccharide/polyol phosphate export permease
LKDIQVVVRLILTGWLFFTPIFYSPNIVPEAILPIYKLNPMYHVVIGYKYALLAGKLLPMWDLAYLSGISLFTFAIGGLLFRRLKPGFAEVL